MGRGASEGFIEAAAPTIADWQFEAEEVVRRSLLDWPTLYKDRSDVLAHLFLNYGTGYGWYQGAVVYPYYEEDIERDRAEDPRSEDVGEVLKGLMLRHCQGPRAPRSAGEAERRYERLLEIAQETTEKFSRNRREIDRISQEGRQLEQIMPITEYSPISSIPDDARPDWLELAAEAAYLGLGSTRTREPFANTDDGAEVRANHVICRRALARIRLLSSQAR